VEGLRKEGKIKLIFVGVYEDIGDKYYLITSLQLY
jgi:hypothetical protein